MRAVLAASAARVAARRACAWASGVAALDISGGPGAALAIALRAHGAAAPQAGGAAGGAGGGLLAGQAALRFQGRPRLTWREAKNRAGALLPLAQNEAAMKLVEPRAGALVAAAAA